MRRLRATVTKPRDAIGSLYQPRTKVTVMKQTHKISSTLKARAPWAAALLSRTYSIAKVRQNKRVVDAASTTWTNQEVKGSHVDTGEVVASHDIRSVIESGHAVVVRDIVGRAGVRDELATLVESSYGVPFEELDQVHVAHAPDEIARITESIKGGDALLTAELKILYTLFNQESALYTELMPNLRPHIPFHELKSHEAKIEATLGRGKLNAHGPHKDSWRFHPRNTVNVWVALTDVSHLNGMFVLPESNAYYPEFSENEIVPGCATYPDRQHITDLKAGDCIIFSAELVHGSILNQTEQTRFAFSMRCTFESPDFHRDFMYNYVQVLPEFSNLTALKLRPSSEFDPPSRDRYSEDFGPQRSALDVAHSSKGKLVVASEGRELTFPRRCPHKGIDLSDGWLEGDCIVCPQHQLRVEPTKVE